MTNSENNKRIAKNTAMLYVRTIIVMLVSLYTSRIVLATLGVQDYGIYNVVGGVVAMFTVISGALSTSISRFLTFELGKGDLVKLKKIFSISINIQVVISIIILIVGETVGLWFLNEKMNIPVDRLEAANWVLHFSLLTFVVNLISIPYNAAIIAHEKMSAFAYVSIVDVSLKLIIVYLLYLSSSDKLILYTILLFLVAVTIRIVYSVYCNRHFRETHYTFVYDKKLIKEITCFSGWGFFINCVYIFNTQGVNILINMFFGVGVNAARGVSSQAEGAIKKFVGDFTTALNPQITKDYASGNMSAMNTLVCRGAKFSFFLLFTLSLPVLMETEYILGLWLKTVPEYTFIFLRLGIIGTMITTLGDTGYTACMATGNIKRYVLWITLVGMGVFPITWLVYKLGAPVYATYIVYILVYTTVNFVRLWIMKGLLNFPIRIFLREVIIKVILVSVLAVILPLVVVNCFDTSFLRLVVSCMISLLSAIGSIYLLGLTKHERKIIIEQIRKKL